MCLAFAKAWVLVYTHTLKIKYYAARCIHVDLAVLEDYSSKKMFSILRYSKREGHVARPLLVSMSAALSTILLLLRMTLLTTGLWLLFDSEPQ